MDLYSCIALLTLIATVVAGAFLAWRVMKAMKEYPQRVTDALAQLNRCMEEIAEFKQYFADHRAMKKGLVELLESL